jgi:hypothetical protein
VEHQNPLSALEERLEDVYCPIVPYELPACVVPQPVYLDVSNLSPDEVAVFGQLLAPEKFPLARLPPQPNGVEKPKVLEEVEY